VGIRIDKEAAKTRLEEAADWAQSDRPVPLNWVELTEVLEGASQKTYTPALGTALLAKATNRRVDPLSIKDKYSENSYSLRTLCHSVLVPAAVRMRFSLRNTGREPLNNQPFFRYNHMSEIDRIQATAQPMLDALRNALVNLAEADEDEALAALAAFLRVRFRVAKTLTRSELPEVEVPLDRLMEMVDAYLSEDVDRPRRTQALAAAAFDLIFRDNRSRRINDPSRDWPGDVQAFDGSIPIMSVEIRAKAVSRTEAIAYVESLRRTGISRGFLVVLHPSHGGFDRDDLIRWAWSSQHVVLTILETVAELLHSVIAWSDLSVEGALGLFAARALARLQEIEALPESIARWQDLVRGASRMGG